MGFALVCALSRSWYSDNFIRVLLGYDTLLDEVRKEQRALGMSKHADEMDEAKRLLAEIKSRFNCVESYITEFPPVMGVHTGPGLLAIGFYCE